MVHFVHSHQSVSRWSSLDLGNEIFRYSCPSCIVNEFMNIHKMTGVTMPRWSGPKTKTPNRATNPPVVLIIFFIEHFERTKSHHHEFILRCSITGILFFHSGYHSCPCVGSSRMFHGSWRPQTSTFTEWKLSRTESVERLQRWMPWNRLQHDLLLLYSEPSSRTRSFGGRCFDRIGRREGYPLVWYERHLSLGLLKTTTVYICIRIHNNNSFSSSHYAIRAVAKCVYVLLVVRVCFVLDLGSSVL